MPALGAATGDVCPLLTVPADRSAQRYAAGFESSTTALANANASRATASAEAPLDRTSKANGAVSTTTPLAVANSCDARARVEIIAQREPGNLGENHPLTLEARRVLQILGVTPHEEPSISELAALLDQGIPALTLGITRGRDRHTPVESIRLEPIFDGLAQVVSLLQFMDGGIQAA